MMSPNNPPPLPILSIQCQLAAVKRERPPPRGDDHTRTELGAATSERATRRTDRQPVSTNAERDLTAFGETVLFHKLYAGKNKSTKRMSDGDVGKVCSHYVRAFFHCNLLTVNSHCMSRCIEFRWQHNVCSPSDLCCSPVCHQIKVYWNTGILHMHLLKVQ